MAVFTNSYGWIKFSHTVLSGYALAAFLIMGISAWHLLRKNEVDFFKRSFRFAAVWAFVASVIVGISGDFHAVEIAKVQPTKFAAMESVWETKRNAGMSLLLLPDPSEECNAVEALKIPGMLSFLAFHDTNAEIKGLKDFPKELRPTGHADFPQLPRHGGIGTFMILVSLAGIFLSRRDKFEDNRAVPEHHALCNPPPLPGPADGLDCGGTWPPALGCVWRS